MFHIGIATKHPPLPEKGELSELGIDFVECCLDIDPMKRPSAVELMDHPWIQAFSQEIAREMNMENGEYAGQDGAAALGGGNPVINTINEEDEEYEEMGDNAAEEQAYEEYTYTDQRPEGEDTDENPFHASKALEDQPAMQAGSDVELAKQFEQVEGVQGNAAGTGQ